ncbi:MAG TPA: hypothetical protein DD979_01750 [Gammaproteobacteria bacterium]|nr:hypothetical protein [Gammaproteobacteria bacterium]
MTTSNNKTLGQLLYRFTLQPLIWLALLIYMIFESVWESVSDWVFSYTPLLIFSDRIHQFLIGRSRWLVLLVYLIHFVSMQTFALISAHMFLAGNLVMGVVFYAGKGILAIPAIRFFTMEKASLLTFWPIRLAYSAVVYVKNTRPYQVISGHVATLKSQLAARVSEFALRLRALWNKNNPSDP